MMDSNWDSSFGGTSSSNSSRKRSRASSPPPGGVSTTSSRKKPRSANNAQQQQQGQQNNQQNQKHPDASALAAQLKDPSKVNAILNTLMELTHSHEINYAVDPDSNLWQSMVDLVIPSTKEEEKDCDGDKKLSMAEMPVCRLQDLKPHLAWKSAGKVQRPKNLVAPTPILRVVLMIFRNMSFVSSNQRPMAQHTCCLDLFTQCLYHCSSSPSPSPSASTATAMSSIHSSAGIGDGSFSSGSSTSTIALYALQTLMNLAPVLDVTGQRIMSDALFSQTAHELQTMGWGGLYWARKTAAHLDGGILDSSGTATGISATNSVTGAVGVPSAPPTWNTDGSSETTSTDAKPSRQQQEQQQQHQQMLWEIAGPHVTRVWQIFPALQFILTGPHASSTSSGVTPSPPPRNVLVLACDFIKEWLEHATPVAEFPTLYDIWIRAPPAMLQRFVDFLYVPRLGPDALDYINPLTHIVSRVPTLKLCMGYDATVDTDVRDRALEILTILIDWHAKPRTTASDEHDSEEEERFAMTSDILESPRFYHSLVPCLTTKVGRNDAPALASSILKSLGRRQNVSARGRLPLEYIQPKILELASKDARIAQIALGYMYK